MFTIDRHGEIAILDVDIIKSLIRRDVDVTQNVFTGKAKKDLAEKEQSVMKGQKKQREVLDSVNENHKKRTPEIVSAGVNSSDAANNKILEHMKGLQC